MKNLLNLEGVKALSKMEQKSIFGGLHDFMEEGGDGYLRCSDGWEGYVSSCSEWAMWHFCNENDHGSAVICVG